MIPDVISGRYVVQAIVGTGGMAVVYRAFDKKTNRIVAIKVLRPEYESDDEFVRRFSREAEAASKVSHENIVNMLDVGIDGDLRYIVMEYVDGQTLKELIRQRGTIHPDTAIRMAIRILAAVDHAHRNGIVHRDIKPQNILVDNQGRVKVADFGIARLKASQTTRVEGDAGGNALGSVHYFSPEQARGEVADEKSDLYSVGVVMYEMLTGQVPFDGDTSVSVALKHVQEKPRSMRTRRNGISKALDEVVMRALSKDASKRYQSAAEMAADLRKTISHPEGGFVQYPKDPDELEREQEERRRKKQRDRRRVKRLLMGAAVVAVLALIWLIVRYLSHLANTFIMPSVIGKESMQAREELEALSAEVVIEQTYSAMEPDTVIAQSREDGARVVEGARVTLTVSKGAPEYYMRDYVGQNAEEAAEELRSLGVESVTIEAIRSDSPVGTVVATAPGEGERRKDDPVTLTISGKSILMPDLTGLTLEEARQLLRAEGLTPGVITVGSDLDARADTVIGQSVAPNYAALTGTEVDLTINQAQGVLYYPQALFTIIVPLNGSAVRLELETPSGAKVIAYSDRLNAGIRRQPLSSTEPGLHIISVYIDDVLMQRQEVEFE